MKPKKIQDKPSAMLTGIVAGFKFRDGYSHAHHSSVVYSTASTPSLSLSVIQHLCRRCIHRLIVMSWPSISTPHGTPITATACNKYLLQTLRAKRMIFYFHISGAKNWNSLPDSLTSSIRASFSKTC